MNSHIESHNRLNSLDEMTTSAAWTDISPRGEECVGRESKRCRVDYHSNNSDCATSATIVTNNGHDEDEFTSEFESNDDVDYVDDIILEDDSSDVPSEVKVSQVDENDHDDSDSNSDCYSSSSEEEMVDDEEEDDAIDDESEEESVDSECSDSDNDDDVTTDSVSSVSSKIKCVRESSTPPHRLFLPADTSPTYEELKYEEDEEVSSDEESDDEEEPTPQYSQRTYMMGNNRSLRPRMMLPTHHHRLWNRNPSSVSVSSTSSSSLGSIPPQISCHNEKSRRAGVSFNDSVTVYPVFQSNVYSADMICQMYTKRDELRANKLRNKREFAYDLQDWRNATEESDMDVNDDGEFVHPVHDTPPSTTTTPQRPNVKPARPFGGYQVGIATVVHRAKRMRMHFSCYS